MLSVVNGQKKPWDVLPYALWNFTPPLADVGRLSGGVAYDAANQRIYWAQMRGDLQGSSYPVIYVWKVQRPQAPVRQLRLAI